MTKRNIHKYFILVNKRISQKVSFTCILVLNYENMEKKTRYLAVAERSHSTEILKYKEVTIAERGETI